jgi:hypothetical protein
MPTPHRLHLRGRTPYAHLPALLQQLWRAKQITVKLLGIGFSDVVSARHFLTGIHFGHVWSRSSRSRKTRLYWLRL